MEILKTAKDTDYVKWKTSCVINNFIRDLYYVLDFLGYLKKVYFFEFTFSFNGTF